MRLRCCQTCYRKHKKALLRSRKLLKQIFCLFLSNGGRLEDLLEIILMSCVLQSVTCLYSLPSIWALVVVSQIAWHCECEQPIQSAQCRLPQLRLCGLTDSRQHNIICSIQEV